MSGEMNTIPSSGVRAIDESVEEMSEAQKIKAGICPSCGGGLVFQEGCKACYSCGWGGCE